MIIVIAKSRRTDIRGMDLQNLALKTAGELSVLSAYLQLPSRRI